jgi:hypothetical protein
VPFGIRSGQKRILAEPLRFLIVRSCMRRRYCVWRIWRRRVARSSPKIDACPSDEDLLCLDSNLLSSEESRRIKRHVECCSTCQVYLRDLGELLQATAIIAAEDEEYREQRFRPYAEFRRALRERRSCWSESFPTLNGVLPVVAAVLLAAILPAIIARATQYDAATVVQRVVDQEPSEVEVGRSDEPLRFHWIPEDRGDLSLKKLSNAGKLRARWASFVPEGTEPTREIVLLLDSHGFNRQQPLSARRLAAWRSSRSVHSDRVIRHKDLLYVRMTVPRGELREVVVVVREDDWCVVGLAWVFSNLGRLQVERLGSDVFSWRSQWRAPRHEGAAK